MNETGIWSGILNEKLGTFKFIYVRIVELVDSNINQNSINYNINNSSLSLTHSNFIIKDTRKDLIQIIKKSKSLEFLSTSLEIILNNSKNLLSKTLPVLTTIHSTSNPTTTTSKTYQSSRNSGYSCLINIKSNQSIRSDQKICKV